MRLICSAHGDGERPQRIFDLTICEISSDAICFGDDLWIDRGTWILTAANEEYTLSLSYDSDDVAPGQYRVESCAIRFMAEPDYRRSEMLHPKWLGCEVFSVDGDPWGFVVDYEDDGYRKNDGRFVFHDTYKMNWEFGANHREWNNPSTAPDRIRSPECLPLNDYPIVYQDDSNIMLVTREAVCDACGNNTGRWTWNQTITGESWCHICHVQLHGVEFECPACDQTVQSIRWGIEGWCDDCEQEMWC